MSEPVELDLVDDNFFVVRKRCNCNCDPECHCFDGMAIVGELNLGPLLHNLAIAGALTRAFRLGDNAGWEMSENDRLYGDQNYGDAWRPNVKGHAA